MLILVHLPWKVTDFLAFLKRVTNEWEGSIMKVSKTVALAASSALALGSVAPAYAHETRILPATPGQIRLVVGFHAEPASEDNFNAIDVILSTFDGTCPAPNASVNIGKPIDTGGTTTAIDPDAVNLKVQALYLKKAVPPTGPFGSIAPAGIIAKLAITDADPLRELFGNPGTYNSWFRPTHPGNAPRQAAPMGSISRARSMRVPTVFPAPGTRPREHSPQEPPRSMSSSFVAPQAASRRRAPSTA